MNTMLRKYSTGKTILVLFLITNAVYAFMILYAIPLVSGFANGMKVLDMMPGGYDLDYVQKLFTALGEEGRRTYLNLQLPLDMVYPLCFAISYSLLLAWLLKKIQKQQSRLYYAVYLPFLAALADYLENISIITLLKQYPDISETGVLIADRFSVVKSSITAVYFMMVLIVLALWLWYSIRKKKA